MCLLPRSKIFSRLSPLFVLLCALTLVPRQTSAAAPEPLDGFNVIVSSGHPFGSATARVALTKARDLGARAVAIVPFLWQAAPGDPNIVRGSDMSDDELRSAIRDARTLGLKVVVKPHVWVEGSWAGAVAPHDEAGWRTWFQRYRSEIVHIARIAAQEGADIFCVGTELTKTTGRAEWNGLISAARANFPRALVYVAHNADEAEMVPFWHQLDFIGVSLYPPLGADGDRDFRRAAMRASADRMDRVAARAEKKILVAEIGLRSAQGATAKPWESAEERNAPADAELQADVLTDWLGVLDRKSIAGVLIWRWFTDPDAGGPSDTDFTVQGKRAEETLRCAWTAKCAR